MKNYIFTAEKNENGKIIFLENNYLGIFEIDINKFYNIINYTMTRDWEFYGKNIPESAFELQLDSVIKTGTPIKLSHEEYLKAKDFDAEKNDDLVLKKEDLESWPTSEKRRLIRAGDLDAIDVLVNDTEAGVRYSVAIYGSDSHRDKLISDPSHWVRGKVVEFGSDAHRDILVNDTNNYVRSMVAIYGSDYHRDKLVFDSETNVRRSVAENGSVEHLLLLVNDEDDVVKERAKMSLNYI